MKQYTIEGGKELRFLISGTDSAGTGSGSDSSSSGHVCLKSGNAEIFGRELRMKEWVVLPEGSYAVYSWYGCTIEIDETKCEKIHQVSDTPMEIYAGVHGNLELLRDAQIQHDHQGQTKTGGPRVAVVGPGRCGKSTVASILSAYAVRCDRTPVFIDLDTTNNSLSIPGTVTATKITGHADIDAAYGILTKGPLTYYTGYLSPWEHTEIFLGAVESLGKSLDARFQNESNDNSGAIIDTFPLIDMDNPVEYQTLLSALKFLKVDVVLVIGHIRLSQELRNDLKNDGAQVIKMPSPGDVMKRPEKGIVNSESIRRYFEGSPLMPFQPCRRIVKSKDKFKVYKLQNKPVTDSGILPIGQVSVIEPRNYAGVDVNASLEKSVLGNYQTLWLMDVSYMHLQVCTDVQVSLMPRQRLNFQIPKI
mmetsp:Transcript_5671/g.6709  ORF Transcript_5671/g.6709 Transcript_5671/m.6709 type:complete len:419 (-) Transcript_5671:2751-4007(-)